jgi:hypothetical protein
MPVRTMVILDDEVHRSAKAYASRRGTTLSSVIEEALREKLSTRRGRRPAHRVKLPTFRGDGLMPGLSLDDMGTIYDRMDGLR